MRAGEERHRSAMPPGAPRFPSPGRAVSQLGGVAAALHLQRLAGNRAVAQLVTAHDHTDDDSLKYPKFAKQYTVLKKTKVMHSRASTSSPVLSILDAGRIITRADAPIRDWQGRTWVKVTASVNGKDTDGWLNSKDPTQINKLEHRKTDVIMDPATGPKVDDIAQTMFGDCYLLAPLMSWTRNAPDQVRTKLFVTDPTSPRAKHTIRLFRLDESRGTLTEEHVEVTNSFLTFGRDLVLPNGNRYVAGESSGSRGPWVWPALVEKAYNAWPGRHTNMRGDQDDLSGGKHYRAASVLTGELHGSLQLPIANTDILDGIDGDLLELRKAAVIDALAAVRNEKDDTRAERIMAVNTEQKAPDAWRRHCANDASGDRGVGGESKVGGIAFPHTYEVEAADDSAISVRNPWGYYGRVNGRVVEDAAVSVLSWDEAALAFDAVTFIGADRVADAISAEANKIKQAKRSKR